MAYVDFCLLPAPTESKATYLKHAKRIAEICVEHGALEYIDAWGDEIPDGKLTSLSMAVKASDMESVAAWLIVWPDKATRDAGHQKMMSDPRMREGGDDALYDMGRMTFGGFELSLKTTQ